MSIISVNKVNVSLRFEHSAMKRMEVKIDTLTSVLDGGQQPTSRFSRIVHSEHNQEETESPTAIDTYNIIR
jgi:hypothetical protein